MKFLIVLLFFVLTTYLNANLKITTGGQSGTYIQIGKNIKDICEQDYLRTKLDVLTSKGSFDNYVKISTNQANFGLVQYDFLLYAKYNHYKNTENIKVIYPLYNEELHIIVRKDAKIKSLSDLNGKRVLIGSKNSGNWFTANLIKTLANLKWIPIEIGGKKGIDYLNDNKADAMIYVAGRPAKLLKFAKKSFLFFDFSDLELLSFRDSEIGKIYTPTVIPANTYEIEEDRDIKTYAVKSILITNTTTDYTSIKMLSKCIDEKLPELKKKGHLKWKEVKIGFDKNIKWDYHKATYDYLSIKESKKSQIISMFNSSPQTTTSTINSKEITQEQLRKLREFENSLDARITNDLKEINGVIYYVLRKKLQSFMEKLDIESCYRKKVFEKCAKKLESEFLFEFSQKNIDSIIHYVDTKYLVKKYNQYIKEKSEILNLNYQNNIKKELGYSMESISTIKRYYIESYNNLRFKLNKFVEFGRYADKHSGLLDKIKIGFERLLLSGKTSEDIYITEAFDNLKESISLLSNFDVNAIEDIKEKFRDDVKSALANIYPED